MGSLITRRLAACLALAASLFVPFAALAADELSNGWRRSGIGFWGAQPETHEGISENGISVELTLPPGSDVSYRKEGNWNSDNAAIRMSTDNVLQIGNDYYPAEAEFPVSVTFVYGKDALPLGFWGRIRIFYKELWDGFRPSGIRLTYAWGTRIPVGSMYRLWEEETVFILAGKEEAGKEISTARQLSRDFKASYGREPKGPVTKVIVEARRPSGTKGPAKTSVTLKYPLE